MSVAVMLKKAKFYYLNKFRFEKPEGKENRLALCWVLHQWRLRQIFLFFPYVLCGVEVFYRRSFSRRARHFIPERETEK